MSKNADNVQRPSFFNLATEGGRAALEYGAFLFTKSLFNKLPEGDGHPVLVLPGFMTTDKSTSPLRDFLKSIGYTPYAWELGRNLGDYRYVVDSIDHVRMIYKKYRRKVSVIGWSLGGVYAREIARQCPDMVRQVITLGSPFGGLLEKNNVSWLYTVLSGKKVSDLDSELLELMHLPPPVPSTAIYSKGDGIVSWEHCIEKKECSQTQNVEVKGSHCGLGHNPAVLFCIADRLNQSTRDWKPFVPKPLAAYLFPEPCKVKLSPA